jgi:hypothetical protein
MNFQEKVDKFLQRHTSKSIDQIFEMFSHSTVGTRKSKPTDIQQKIREKQGKEKIHDQIDQLQDKKAIQSAQITQSVDRLRNRLKSESYDSPSDEMAATGEFNSTKVDDVGTMNSNCVQKSIKQPKKPKLKV